MITEVNDKVDYEALASATARATANEVTQSLIQAGVISRNAPPEAKAEFEEFEKYMTDVANAPGSDAATVATIKAAFDKFEKKIESKVSEKYSTQIQNALIQERNRSTIAVVESAIDGYIEKDSLADRFREEIKNNVIRTFTTDPKYKDARDKYNQGDIDIKLFKNLALDVVKQFDKDKPPARAASGVAQRDTAGETQSMIKAGDVGEEGSSSNGHDLKQLTEKERGLYYARLGTMQRAGRDRDSKEAKDYAWRGVQNLRKGQERYRSGERPGFYGVGK